MRFLLLAAKFLAAMSSSRSDGVTQFVRPFVRSFVRSSLFFLLVSLEAVVHFECHKALKSIKGIPWEPMSVSRVFQGSFKGLSSFCIKGVLRMWGRTFQASSKGVSRYFKGVSRKFQDCLKVVFQCFNDGLRQFQGRLKIALRTFQGSFGEVLRLFQERLNG